MPKCRFSKRASCSIVGVSYSDHAYKNEQRLASARYGVIFIFLGRYLHLFRCARTLPPSDLVVLLVRPSLRALLAVAAIRLEVTRHDLEHGIHSHLLSLLRCRVGLKLRHGLTGSGLMPALISSSLSYVRLCFWHIGTMYCRMPVYSLITWAPTVAVSVQPNTAQLMRLENGMPLAFFHMFNHAVPRRLSDVPLMLCTCILISSFMICVLIVYHILGCSVN